MQEWVEGEKGPWEQDGERLLTIGLQCSVLQVLDSGNEYFNIHFFSFSFPVISLIADGPHHYHPACSH